MSGKHEWQISHEHDTLHYRSENWCVCIKCGISRFWKYPEKIYFKGGDFYWKGIPYSQRYHEKEPPCERWVQLNLPLCGDTTGGIL